MQDLIFGWVEVYGDVGFMLTSNKPRFLYDSGIRLNLVHNYFDIFPVYSSNGWEASE
jgi:hypothetical protein